MAFQFFGILAATLAGVAPVAAEAPSPAALQRPVVSVTFSLVQVDAVVTDKDGRHVPDLTASDFEILEDGKPQEITNCTYVALPEPPAAGSLEPVDPRRLGAPKLKAEDVRRTIALVVDDLGLSFESAMMVRNAVRKYVREQIQPGDLVAIVRTGSGAGALQQFTSDKRMLEAAADRVRYNPVAPLDAFDPIGSEALLSAEGSGSQGSPKAAVNSFSLGEDADQLRKDAYTVGTLSALKAVIAGLRDLPGRKSLLFFSEGFSFFNSRLDQGDLLDRLRHIVEIANRASVVIYTVDARGLATRGLTAADRVGSADPMTDDPLAAVSALQSRHAVAIETQQSMVELATQTGGLFFHDQGVTGAVGRIMADQSGYYLIGYAPDASSFAPSGKRPEYHRIKVRAKRPGLRVRSRSGFYGVADSERRGEAPRTLAGALLSPFANGDIDLRLSSVFFQELPKLASVRSFLYVEPQKLTFTKTDDGQMSTHVDIVAVTFGEDGAPVDQIGRGHEIRFTPERYEQVLKKGLIYTLNIPIRKAGSYQLRVALRDLASGRVGSASQYVEVPDVSKKKLALSGILIGSAGSAGPSTAEGTQDTDDPEATQAVRRFRPGAAVSYGLMVYNSKQEKSAGPKLQSQMRLFRDGHALKTGESRSIDATGQKDVVFTGGGLLLGPEMPPGDYVLELAVTDTLADKKHQVATRAIDFEVAP